MGKENKQKNAFQTKNIMGNIQKKYIFYGNGKQYIR